MSVKDLHTSLWTVFIKFPLQTLEGSLLTVFSVHYWKDITVAIELEYQFSMLWRPQTPFTSTVLPKFLKFEEHSQNIFAQ